MRPELILFPEFQPIVGIAQGLLGGGVVTTTPQCRIGRKILVKSLLITGTISTSAVSGDVTDIVYLYILKDKQANGAYPGISDIWSNVAPSQCLRNLDFGKRFKILKSLKWTLAANDAALPRVEDFEVFIKMNLPVVYSGATGAIAEIKENNIVVVWGSDKGNSTVNCASRVRFYDN